MTDLPDICGPCASDDHLSCMGGCACSCPAEKGEKIAQQLRPYMSDEHAVKATNGVLMVLANDGR